MSWNIGHKTFYKPSFLITSSSWPYFLITVGFVNGYDMKMKNHIWLLSLSLKQSTFSFPEFDVDISSKQQPFQVNTSFFHSINQKAPTLNELSFSNLSIPTPVFTIIMHQGRPVDKLRLQKSKCTACARSRKTGWKSAFVGVDFSWVAFTLHSHTAWFRAKRERWKIFYHETEYLGFTGNLLFLLEHFVC